MSVALDEKALTQFGVRVEDEEPRLALADLDLTRLAYDRWGPRHWSLEWPLLVLNGDRLRLQCAEAVVPGAGRFAVGSVQREKMTAVQEVRVDLRIRDDDVLRPVSGRFSLRSEDGAGRAGEIASITGTEIDLSHTFVPPRRSHYRRALVRVALDDGGVPLLGWLELDRFGGGGAR